MPVTAAQRKQYVKKLDELIRDASLFTDATVEKVLDLLKDFERRVRLTLYGFSEDKMWAIRHWRTIQNSITDLIGRFQAQLQAAGYEGFERIAEFGDDIVERPLFELGLNIPIISVGPEFLIIADEYSADLITTVGEDLRKVITQRIRFGLSGEKTAFEVMGEITKDLGTKTIGKETVRGVAYQAERQVRTEMHRVQGMASQARMKRAVDNKLIPDLKKGWMATFINSREGHIEAHNKYMKEPIAVDQPFRVRANFSSVYEELWYPGDPRGSASNTVQCRCHVIPIIPT